MSQMMEEELKRPSDRELPRGGPENPRSVADPEGGGFIRGPARASGGAVRQGSDLSEESFTGLDGLRGPYEESGMNAPWEQEASSRESRGGTQSAVQPGPLIDDGDDGYSRMERVNPVPAGSPLVAEQVAEPEIEQQAEPEIALQAPAPEPASLADALGQRKRAAAAARGPEPEAVAPQPVGKAGSRSALLDKMIGAGEWLGKGVGMVKEASDTTGLYGTDIPEVIDRIGESDEGLRSGADSVLEGYAPVQEWMQRAHGVTDAANKIINPLPKVKLGTIGHEDIKLGVGTKEVLGLATGVAKVAQYHKNEGADPLATAGSERAAVDAGQMQFRRALEARRRVGRLYDTATGPLGGRDPISTPDGRVQDLLGREKQRANLIAMQKGMRLALRAGELGKAQEKKGVRPLNEYSMEQTAYLNDREFVAQKPLGFFEKEDKRRWAPKKGMLNAEGEIDSAADLAGPAGQSVFDRYDKAKKGEPVPDGLMPGMRERDDLAALPDGYRDDIEGGRSKQRQVAAFRFAKRAGELAEGTLNSDRMVRDGRYKTAYAAKFADAALTTGAKSAASAAQAGLLLGTGGVAAPLIAAAEAGKTLAFHGKEQLGLGLQWTAEKAEGLIDPKGLAKEQDNRDLYNKHFGLTKPAAGGDGVMGQVDPVAREGNSVRSSVQSSASDSDDVVSTESEIRAEEERMEAQYRAMFQGLAGPAPSSNAGGSPEGSVHGSMELSDNGKDGLTTIAEESESSDTSSRPSSEQIPSSRGTAVHPLFQQASAPQPMGEYDPIAELMNRKHEYFGMPPEEFQAAQQQRNPELAAREQLAQEPEQQIEQEPEQAQQEPEPQQAGPAMDPLADPTARAQDIRTRGIHWEKQGDRAVVGRRKKTWGRAIKDATWGGVKKVGMGLVHGVAALATLPYHAAIWAGKGFKGLGSLFKRKKKDTSNPARNALKKLQAESKMGDLDRPQFDWSSISQADINQMSKEEQYQFRMQREKYDEVFGVKAHAGAARAGGTRQAAKDALMAKPEVKRAEETAALREQLAPGPNTPRMASGEILELLRGRARQDLDAEQAAGGGPGGGGPGGGGPGGGDLLDQIDQLEAEEHEASAPLGRSGRNPVPSPAAESDALGDRGSRTSSMDSVRLSYERALNDPANAEIRTQAEAAGIDLSSNMSDDEARQLREMMSVDDDPVSRSRQRWQQMRMPARMAMARLPMEPIAEGSPEAEGDEAWLPNEVSDRADSGEVYQDLGPGGAEAAARAKQEREQEAAPWWGSPAHMDDLRKEIADLDARAAERAQRARAEGMIQPGGGRVESAPALEAGKEKPEELAQQPRVVDVQDGAGEAPMPARRRAGAEVLDTSAGGVGRRDMLMDPRELALLRDAADPSRAARQLPAVKEAVAKAQGAQTKDDATSGWREVDRLQRGMVNRRWSQSGLASREGLAAADTRQARRDDLLGRAPLIDASTRHEGLDLPEAQVEDRRLESGGDDQQRLPRFNLPGDDFNILEHGESDGGYLDRMWERPGDYLPNATADKGEDRVRRGLLAAYEKLPERRRQLQMRDLQLAREAESKIDMETKRPLFGDPKANGKFDSLPTEDARAHMGPITVDGREVVPELPGGVQSFERQGEERRLYGKHYLKPFGGEWRDKETNQVVQTAYTTGDGARRDVNNPFSAANANDHREYHYEPIAPEARVNAPAAGWDQLKKPGLFAGKAKKVAYRQQKEAAQATVKDAYKRMRTEGQPAFVADSKFGKKEWERLETQRQAQIDAIRMRARGVNHPMLTGQALFGIVQQPVQRPAKDRKRK